MTASHPAVQSIFRILPPVFDVSSGQASFRYQLDDLAFTEKLHFPIGFDANKAEGTAWNRLLNLTAIVLGTSYFKLRAPFSIDLGSMALSPEERDFALDVYENGLGEFYARNNLARYGKLSLSADHASNEPGGKLALSSRILLPIGGGKDSLVSVQLLERAKLAFTPFAVNPQGPILTSVDALAAPGIFVRRELDPKMIRLSIMPGFYNGHVPSTAINSMIAALTCLLFDHDTIILSNERSASEGNVMHDGREANHQYSKSLEFEKRIAAVLAAATGGGLKYFSLLRPHSEVRIAQIFAREGRFDSVFSSCNQNFRLSGHDGPLWCGKCPKCHFTFLVLAPQMDKQRLLKIFGANLLDHSANTAPYRELSGLAGQKPWECVGEILEAAACLYQLALNPDWQNDAVVSQLRAPMIEQYGEAALLAAWAELLTDSQAHLLPSFYATEVASHGF